MAQFVQALALGVLIGGIYALMASGLTLIFGVLHIINIAQGAFLILVATVTWWMWRLCSFPSCPRSAACPASQPLHATDEVDTIPA